MIILNDKEVNFGKFPNGETLIKHEDLCIFKFGENKLTFKYQDDLDLIKLMLITKHIKNTTLSYTELNIAYMPYSRMDRSEKGSVFTLKYIADFINDLEFDCVRVLDPHSDVTMALLNNCTYYDCLTNMVYNAEKDINFNKDIDYLYFPDTSAQKKYSKLFEGYKYITSFKDRDFKTGEITGLTLLGDIDVDNFKVIMIDDLICKGGSMYYGALELKKYGASDIVSVVNHCEDSIYASDATIFKDDMIGAIYTTNSILTNESDKRLKVKNIL